MELIHGVGGRLCGGVMLEDVDVGMSVSGSLTASPAPGSRLGWPSRTVCVTASERPTTAFNRCIDPEFVAAWQARDYCLQDRDGLSQPSRRHLAGKEGIYSQNYKEVCEGGWWWSAVGGGGGRLYNNIEAQVSQTLWRKWRTQYPYILSNIRA